jgi:hypothetical protein
VFVLVLCGTTIQTLKPPSPKNNTLFSASVCCRGCSLFVDFTGVFLDEFYSLEQHEPGYLPVVAGAVENGGCCLYLAVRACMA